MRIVRVIGWSVGLALLFAIVLGLVKGWDSIAQPAIVGAMFGAIIGAANEKLITRWTEGALIGAVIGAIGGIVLWLTVPSEERQMSLAAAVLIFMIGSALAAAVFSAFTISLWGTGGRGHR